MYAADIIRLRNESFKEDVVRVRFDKMQVLTVTNGKYDQGNAPVSQAFGGWMRKRSNIAADELWPCDAIEQQLPNRKALPPAGPEGTAAKPHDVLSSR